MRVVDAISQILKREGVDFLACYPTNTLIEAAAAAGIKPLICRQERVGVGIADGYTRISNGRRIGVFTMQAGPGAENAYSGITTAYSDSVPVLLLPVGHEPQRFLGEHSQPEELRDRGAGNALGLAALLR